MIQKILVQFCLDWTKKKTIANQKKIYVSAIFHAACIKIKKDVIIFKIYSGQNNCYTKGKYKVLHTKVCTCKGKK